ncbi:MAG: hypothetical protein ACRD0P_01185 [Stackebrandtia sp.]
MTVWSLGYTALGLYWMFGGSGFPFAVLDDDHMTGSILEGADRSVLAPLMTGFGVLGAAAGVAMARSWGRGRSRKVPLGFAWLTAIALTFGVQDYSILVIVAFSPLLVVFTFTGVPGPQDGIGDILYWHRLNLVILFVGGVLWAAARFSPTGSYTAGARSTRAGSGSRREDQYRRGRPLCPRPWSPSRSFRPGS